MSEKSVLLRKPALAAGILAWGAAAFLGGSAALAGSVFMKNGYIIQGPIVERSDEAIVMGWPNGKVTIHKRFVDNILFEATEEKRLLEDEAFKAQEKARSEEDLSLLATSNESEDLPPNLDALMRRYEELARKQSGSGSGESGAGTSVERIDPPGDMLGERVEDRTVSVSFQPPRSWGRKSNKDFFEVAAKTEVNGFRPSLNVVTFPRGALKSDEYVNLLKEEDARTLEGFELLSEGPRMIGQEKGYELVGRGSYQGKEAIVRQVIVSKDDRVWLISAFTSDQGSDSSFSAVDESLKTFAFLGAQPAR
jgi:hypothetical protein